MGRGARPARYVAGYEAGPDGLEMLMTGAPDLGEDARGDVDGLRGWWTD
jgi:hypothetical protein